MGQPNGRKTNLDLSDKVIIINMNQKNCKNTSMGDGNDVGVVGIGAGIGFSMSVDLLLVW